MMSEIVEQADKFRIIPGIGEAREKWLQETFNVYTFQALASLTVSQIEDELKQAPSAISRKVERDDIVAWLYEARKLSVPKSNKKGEAEWHKAAFIIVEFQTRANAAGTLEAQTTVFDMVSEQGDKWSGHNIDELSKWMAGLAQQITKSPSKEIVPASEPRKTAPKAVPEQPTVTFEMVQLLLFQPPTAAEEAGIGLPGTVFSGVLLGDVPFTMECHLVVGLEANVDNFAESVPYRLELFATNRETGKVIPLGRRDEVAEKAGLQKVAITEVSLAGGVYRVEAIVTSPDFPCQPGFMEIPLLRTV